MNVDATYFEDGSGAAAAAILRKSKGEAMMACRAWVLKSLLNSTTEEAVALQRGLSMVQDLGCIGVIMESDSLELIQTCNGIIKVWTPYTTILADCFQMALFYGCSVSHPLSYLGVQTGWPSTRFTFSGLNVEVDWDGHPPSFILLYI